MSTLVSAAALLLPSRASAQISTEDILASRLEDNGNIETLYNSAATGRPVVFAWQDIAHIRGGGEVFVDVDPYDGFHNFREDGQQDGCYSEIDITDGQVENNQPITQAIIRFRSQDPTSGQCRVSRLAQAQIGQAARKNVSFFWVDAGRLQHVLGDVYTRIQGEAYSFGLDRGNGCSSTINPNGGENGPGTSGRFTERTPAFGCQDGNSRDVQIMFPEARRIAAGQGELHDTLGRTGNGQDNGSNPPSCEENGADMGWLLCSAIRLADSVLGWLDEQIISMLETPPSYLNSDLEVVWARMRNIAYLILIPIALVMVISTAMGFEFVSAYTIKRALPRLVIAVIFIALSWDLLIFAVEMINNIGRGTLNLITFSFDGANEVRLATIFNPDGADTALAGLGFLAATAVAASLATFGVIFTFAISAFVPLAIGFVLLAFRRLAIVFLVVTAPLAILAWIFPGNDKLWKLWWGTFSKLLLMFPVLMALFGTGRVFAVLVRDSGGGEGIVNTVIAGVGYVGPIAAASKTIDWGLAGLTAITGGLVNRGKSWRQQLSKRRSGTYQKNLQALKAGNRFEGRGWIPGSERAARRFGAMTRGAATGTRGGFGLGTRGQQATHQAVETSAGEIMKGDGFQRISQNDDALMALTYDTEREARADLRARGRSDRQIDDTIAAAKASGLKFGDQGAQYAAMQQLANTTTGYDDMEQMVQTAARVSHGRRSTESASAGFLNATVKKGGNRHLAPGFGTLQSLVRQEGSGIDIAAGDVPANWETAREASWNNASLYEHANGKAANLRSHVDFFQQMMNSRDPVRQRRAAIFFEELRAMKPNASGENANTINEALENNQAALNNYYNLGAHAAQTMVVDASYERTRQEVDPTTGQPVINPVTGVPNTVTERVPQTTTINGARVERANVSRDARTYERPDPNNQ